MPSTDAAPQPAWNHSKPALCIRLLFAEPYWIDEPDRKITGQRWISIMSGYQIYLDQYASVIEWGVTIYDHVQSRNMPKTTNEKEKWPDGA